MSRKTSKKTLTTAAAIGLAGVLTSQAQAQSAGNQDAEIALLKQQLRLMEQKLDKLEKQTAVNTIRHGQGHRESREGRSQNQPKTDVKTDAKLADAANANAAYPVKGPFPPPGVAVTLAEQPADDLHRGRTELRFDHQPHHVGCRRLRLPSQFGGNQSAKTR